MDEGGGGLRSALRVLAGVEPLCNFITSLPDVEQLPVSSQLSRRASTSESASSIWRAAADQVLKDLRGERDEVANVKKAELRQLLKRVKRSRREEQVAQWNSIDYIVERQGVPSPDLPSCVQEPLKGIYVKCVREANTDDESEGSEAVVKLAQKLSVEDVIDVGNSLDGLDKQAWAVYRLTEDRLQLLLDQGRCVLIVASGQTAACLLCGILLRCWPHCTAVQAVDFLQRRGFHVTDQMVSWFGRDEASLIAAVRRHFRLASATGGADSAASLAQALGCEVVEMTTQATVAQALHLDALIQNSLASSGQTLLAFLRALRQALPERQQINALQRLVSVSYCAMGKTLIQDGVTLEFERLSGEAGITSHSLNKELMDELRGAVALPSMLIVSIEGSGPVDVEEYFAVADPANIGRLRRYVMATLASSGGTVLMRKETGNSSGNLGSGHLHVQRVLRDDGEEIIRLSNLPGLVVLMDEAMAATDTLQPWSCVAASGKDGVAANAKASSAVPRAAPSASSAEVEVTLVSFVQFERLRFLLQGRGTESPGKALEQADTLLRVRVPQNSRIAALQKRVATELQVDKLHSKSLIFLAPSDGGAWRQLLPEAEVASHAWQVAGMYFLVATVPSDKAASLVSTPCMCYAWVDFQLTALDVMAFDLYKPLTSHAAEISCQLEDEIGPQSCNSAFVVTEYLGAIQGPGRPVNMNALVATSLPAIPSDAGDGASLPLRVLVWQPVPLTPSMTGRCILAAQEMACVREPFTVAKQYPLEQIVMQKTAELQASGAAGLERQRAPKQSADVAKRPAARQLQVEARQFEELHQLEERFLIAWCEDCTEGLSAVAGKARLCIDAALSRLQVEAPDEAPPGLRKWPEEPSSRWTPRTWERVCLKAAGWADPDSNVTEEIAARGLLWLEASMLNDIILTVDALGVTGPMVLSGAKKRAGLMPQVLYLRKTWSEQGTAELAHFAKLLQEGSGNAFFDQEVQNLPSECNSDIGGLHALVQSTNAELNAVWKAQCKRAQGESDRAPPDEAVVMRLVRLRELALYAMVLLIKQAQSVRLLDAVTLGWLREVQAGCQMILQKSQVLCEAISLDTVRVKDRAEVPDRLVKMQLEVKESLQVLDSLLSQPPVMEGSSQASAQSSNKQEASEQLSKCNSQLLSGHMLLHNLERQLEASGESLDTDEINLAKSLRAELHVLMIRTEVVRARLDLPNLESAEATLTPQSQRPGRDLRKLGRHNRKPAANACDGAREETSGDGDGLVASAEVRAEELLRSERKELAKKAKKARKQQQKQRGGMEALQTPPPNGKEEETKTPSTAAGSPRPALAKSMKEEQAPSGSSDKLAATIDCPSPGVSAQAPNQEDVGRAEVPRSEPAKVSPQENLSNIMGGLGQAPELPACRGDKAADLPGTCRADVHVTEAVVELLSRRRKAKLLEIQRAAGATCTLHASRQLVTVEGSQDQVAIAKLKLEELQAEWLDVEEAVWVTIVAGRSAADGYLSSLVVETGCHVQVDRNVPKIFIAGTGAQVSAAKAFIEQLSESCAYQLVWLETTRDRAEAALEELRTSSVRVKWTTLTKPEKSCVQVCGDAAQVASVVEKLQSLPPSSPMGTRCCSSSSAPCSHDDDIDDDTNYWSGIRTPSEWSSGGELGDEHHQCVDSLEDVWCAGVPCSQPLVVLRPEANQDDRHLAEQQLGKRPLPPAARPQETEEVVSRKMMSTNRQSGHAVQGNRRDAEQELGHITAQEVAKRHPGARIFIGPPDTEECIELHAAPHEFSCKLPPDISEQHGHSAPQAPSAGSAKASCDDPERLAHLMQQLGCLLQRD